jgi:hypothetical protein
MATVFIHHDSISFLCMTALSTTFSLPRYMFCIYRAGEEKGIRTLLKCRLTTPLFENAHLNAFKIYSWLIIPRNALKPLDENTKVFFFNLKLSKRWKWLSMKDESCESTVHWNGIPTFSLILYFFNLSSIFWALLDQEPGLNGPSIWAYF